LLFISAAWCHHVVAGWLAGCPSVCLSHSCIVWKWLKIRSLLLWSMEY